MVLDLTRRGLLASAGALASCAAVPTTVLEAPPEPLPAWTRLTTEPFRGKQDDVFFADLQHGWYGNLGGNLFRTSDGGATWSQVLKRPGTGVRAIGFVDRNLGFFGNVGAEYNPIVTDETPLYRTRDGGLNWDPVTVGQGTPARGVCAIDVLRTPFVNAGVLDHRTTVRAAGRVGGPSFLMESFDAGETWRSREMSDLTGMILDVKFIDANVGFIAGATDSTVSKSSAAVLKTTDGGRTWRRVYASTRPFEITWKLAFPSPKVGYVTIQNYDPDKTVTQRYVAKTIDGGETWRELPVTDDYAFREFGIGFVDERRGWIGGSTTGVETLDGGLTWRRVEMGKAVNKIRVHKGPHGVTAFAVGVDLHKLEMPARA